MKNTYPVILTPDEPGYIVHIPDFDNDTEGDSLTEAIEMARDAIGLLGIAFEDKGLPIPSPSDISSVAHEPDELVTLVDIDFAEYRRKNDMRTVKKNCTLPSWLCSAAEQAGINFSQVLQEALKVKLNLT